MTAMFNGFANRFLFACVAAASCCRIGGASRPRTSQTGGIETVEAIERPGASSSVTMTPNAASSGRRSTAVVCKDQSGLLGAITARAEAHTIRLALVYACSTA